MLPETIAQIWRTIPTSKLHGSTTTSHLAFLYLLSRYAKGDVIEFGVGGGNTTVPLVSGMVDRPEALRGMVYSYDIDLGTADRARVRLGRLKRYEQELWKWGYGEGARAAAGHADKSAGLVWIDSGHSFQGTVEELIAWRPKVMTGGVIAGHDYDFPQDNFGVRRAVAEFMSRFSPQYDLTTFGNDVGIFVITERSAPLW